MSGAVQKAGVENQGHSLDTRGHTTSFYNNAKGETMKPEKTIKGLTFFPIPEFDDLTAAFGAPESAYFNRRDLPEVPKKFEDMASNIFFSGGKLDGLSPQVDKTKAIKAVRAWLSSFAPAHESKIATVGYALWLWSDDKALNEVLNNK